MKDDQGTFRHRLSHFDPEVCLAAGARLRLAALSARRAGPNQRKCQLLALGRGADADSSVCVTCVLDQLRRG